MFVLCELFLRAVDDGECVLAFDFLALSQIIFTSQYPPLINIDCLLHSPVAQAFLVIINLDLAKIVPDI